MSGVPPHTFANTPEFPCTCHDFRHENGTFSLGLRRKCFIISERGEGGIRTLGTLFGVRRFSKALLSTTQPPHQKSAARI
jgi:hypothetical protein